MVKTYDELLDMITESHTEDDIMEEGVIIDKFKALVEKIKNLKKSKDKSPKTQEELIRLEDKLARSRQQEAMLTQHFMNRSRDRQNNFQASLRQDRELHQQQLQHRDKMFMKSYLDK